MKTRGNKTMDNQTMWALVKEKPEVGIWAKRVPIPEVGYNDVKIKIKKNIISAPRYKFTAVIKLSM